jgi:hypothetical protein
MISINAVEHKHPFATISHKGLLLKVYILHKNSVYFFYIPQHMKVFCLIGGGLIGNLSHKFDTLTPLARHWDHHVSRGFRRIPFTNDLTHYIVTVRFNLDP